MTTYPTSGLDALDSGGAFEIGGGDFDFGQAYTESTIRSMFSVPLPTPETALDLFRQQLMKLPQDALNAILALLPDVTPPDLASIGAAVDKIMGSLNPESLIKGLQTGVANAQSAINQIGDILTGAIVTPISAAVAAFQDWFTSLFGGSGSALKWSSVPSSSTAAGTDGKIARDHDYLYVCTATNTWGRVAFDYSW
ncbi:hypothetical protein MycrhDRAFT_6911 [Mycolicibacterium rhodesiae JS60]|nr:hypothetical protein MycrhDRAFT_6911 [Mycolicibacterium rhodesiae JS60]